jgi:hypothetical protein
LEVNLHVIGTSILPKNPVLAGMMALLIELIRKA